MHSAEHLLNQTMTRMFDCGRCFNAHIEKKKSKCDYHFDRALTAEEIRELEDRINDIIRNDLRVMEELITQVSHPFRGSKALTALQIAPM